MGPNFLLVLDVVTRAAMLARIRNPDCEQDTELKQDLKRYVLQNLSRREMLDFFSRDYAQYAWSLGTLSRRLAYFDIKYVEYNTDLKEVEAAMQSELEGPGQLLGYRSMQRKIREQHQLAVPRNLVYNLMTELDSGWKKVWGTGEELPALSLSESEFEVQSFKYSMYPL